MPIFNVCGTNYQYPNVGDKPWGTIHIAWASAVSSCLTSLNTQVSGIAANQFLNPMTTNGDLITQASGLPARIGVGADGQVLTVVAGAPAWSAVAGTGDVVGPAGAVDENIAVFDGVTGKLLKDGGITVAAILAQIQPITLWADYTPSAGGTWGSSSTLSGKWRRVGDTGEYQINVAMTGAAPGATALSLSLPPSQNIDTSKIFNLGGTFNVVGFGTLNDSSSGDKYVLHVYTNGGSTVSIVVNYLNSDKDEVLLQGSPISLASGDTINISFRLPIVEFA